ncbi:penicillin-binding transpeptidase domain-containing protein [Terrisporobacter sp.]|uniref:penicillin-binding transpeptidase domain-containing protein n=1 Tax=Terrisporobacter sp. TaxID=1965305 RepID=UPI0026365A8A|nr:penicillin-binding transpeptidase domain-containing protein [Terrisporobacter sp.]
MDEKRISERTKIIQKVFTFIFIAIIVKILYMNIFKYDYYTSLADNKTYKEVTIKASRGEIRDRYGRLLAGNVNQFTAQVSINEFTRNDTKEDKSEANNTSLKLINLLEQNGEEYEDEFPIVIKGDNYYYTFDEEIKEFKRENDVPLDYNAKETFYYIVDKLIEEGKLTEEDKNLKPSELQKKVNEAGTYPPILVSKFIFTAQREKNDWLEGYKVKKWLEENKIDKKSIDAKTAFKAIRDYYLIDPDLSDKEARKILVVRDLIKSQGYTKYQPVTIAKNIGEETIADIEEMAMELPGVSVSNEPVRSYPNGNLASHVLGYVGKIPSSQEESYLEKGYSKNDMVGLSGVEGKYEEKLHGTDGYKKVKVDAVGNITENLEVVKPVSGDTLYLTIDKDLQEVAEKALEKAIKAARYGGVYESEYGNVSASGGSKNAASGAVIVADVKTGEVLASASYPNFDPNLFVSGISSEDYKKLMPENKNDLLAPAPLLNLVTQGAFQPGSTFKMITGMAALEHGLSPNYTISDPGVIWLGKKSYGDAVWNSGRGNHGATNLYKAIQESCNIYFYTIGTGQNMIGGAQPSAKIGPEEVMEYAKLFGLDDYTGLDEDIEENKGTVPSEERKIESMKSMLKSYLNRSMKNSFTDINKDSNPEEFASRIQEITNWCDEEKAPGKVEVVERLKKLKVKEDDLEPLSDEIVYTYLNFARWTTSDAFNLSIGQGENAYTPAQMVRYISAIANGGYLNKLYLVQKSISADYSKVDVKEQKSEKINFVDSNNLDHLVTGMKRVVTDGTARKVLGDLNVSIAAKTGTAQKSTKIPTENEYEYLMSHLSSYKVDEKEVLEVYNKLRAEREEELTKIRIEEIKEQLADKDVSDETKAELEKELKAGVSEKLPTDNDRINAAYLRRAIKELNPKITDEQIDAFKETYGDFAEAAAFLPADDPEIAIYVMIPQGGSSSHALLPMRDIIGYYMGLEGKSSNETNKKTDEENDNNLEEDDINFSTQLKK